MRNKYAHMLLGTLGILVAFAMVAVVIGAFGPLPAEILGTKTRGMSPVDLVKAESDVRTSLLQAVAGLLLVVGAATAWRQLQISRAQHILGQRIAVMEAFTKAVEQLSSSSSMAIRIGGAYALDRIAENSPTEQERIAELLTAFVRERATGERLEKDLIESLTILSRRAWPTKLDLVGVRLANVRLPQANLMDASLHGADLSNAVLRSADLRQADLSETDLRHTDLAGADLRGAELRGARLSGAKANNATRWPIGYDPAQNGVLIA